MHFSLLKKSFKEFQYQILKSKQMASKINLNIMNKKESSNN